MKLSESVVGLIIPDFDFGGEEKRVVFFANEYVKYFKKVYVFSPIGKSTALLDPRVIHIDCKPRNILNVVEIIKLIRVEGIDYLQGHKRATLPYLYLCEKFTRAKCIFNFDNIYLKYNKICKYIMPKYVIYLSETLETFYEPFHRKSSGRVINMGGEFLNILSNAEIERLRDEFDVTGKFIILSLGRLSAQKNHQLLFKALKELQDLNFVCLIAGVGELDRQLCSLSDSLGIAGKVRFLGHRTDICELLNISDVLVQTSVFEGFPNVFIEAASVGLPIISTDVGSSALIVKDNGVLIKSGDTSALVTAIRNMTTSGHVFKKAALEYRASENFQQFSKSNMLLNYLRFYKEI